MSTPRQERGVLADILARCAICGAKDHKTQMFTFSPEDWAPGDPDSWLCHICQVPFDEDGDGDNGDQEPPAAPSPRSRRTTANSRRTPKN